MAEIKPIVPGAPLRPVDDRPEQPERRRQPPRRPRREPGLTDDQGEGRDDPPLIDEYA